MDPNARLQVLEDIEAIRTLKYRYCQACDDDHNPQKLGPLFTEDAVWEATSMGRANGRLEIQAMLGDLGRSGRIRNSAHNAINPIIEVDGEQHAENAYDQRRDEELKGRGFTILRFWNYDIRNDLDDVCHTILGTVGKV